MLSGADLLSIHGYTTSMSQHAIPSWVDYREQSVVECLPTGMPVNFQKALHGC